MDSSSAEDEDNFYRRGVGVARPPQEQQSSVQASPARRSLQQQPEYKVVNIKEPPKSYDSSFHCIHTSIEIVVVVSLICATSELVLGFWVLFVLSKTSSHTSSSKYITIGVGMFVAQSVRIYALVTWLKSSKQYLVKAYSATSLCILVSILVLLPIGCFVLFVGVVVFEVVVFLHVRPQMEVLEAFMLVAGFDLAFSICYGSIVACCFQNRLQKRQIYLLRNSNTNQAASSSQIQLNSPAPPRRKRSRGGGVELDGGNCKEPLLPLQHQDYLSFSESRNMIHVPQQPPSVIHTYPSFSHNEFFYANSHQNNAMVAYV